MKVSLSEYSDFPEVARTKSGKRAAVKQTRKPGATKASNGKCPTGKLRLKDHKQAVRSLHRAKGAAAIELENNGSTSRQECRTYFCGMCKGYHMTSKREWTTFNGQVAA